MATGTGEAGPLGAAADAGSFARPMAQEWPGGEGGLELAQEKYDAEENVKIICLGDSAVGKSK